LTPEGVAKCKNAQASLLEYDLDPFVLCSPYRRTIETAVHMLKEHPEKEKFTIVLCPEARERVSY
jgi:phosphohistidine phosphatase SixA